MVNLTRREPNWPSCSRSNPPAALPPAEPPQRPAPRARAPSPAVTASPAVRQVLRYTGSQRHRRSLEGGPVRQVAGPGVPKGPGMRKEEVASNGWATAVGFFVSLVR